MAFALISTSVTGGVVSPPGMPTIKSIGEQQLTQVESKQAAPLNPVHFYQRVMVPRTPSFMAKPIANGPPSGGNGPLRILWIQTPFRIQRGNSAIWDNQDRYGSWLGPLASPE